MLPANGGRSMAQYLQELIQIAARIVQLDQLEGEITDKREWQRGKDEWEAAQEQFNKLRAEYVDALFGDDAPGDSVPDDVQRELASLRDEADPSWYPAIDYTQENLLPFVKKEAGKSPRMRKALRAAPYAAAATALVFYFGVALFSGTPVTEAIETREGIKQRAAAAEKVIRYDDWAGTRVRRGGWLKGILLWPIEPDPYEIKGAGEFIGLVLEAQQYAKGCGSVVGYGDSLSDEQIRMVRGVADVVQRDDLQWKDPAPMTLVAALESVKPC
jgi:hypothetical protein